MYTINSIYFQLLLFIITINTFPLFTNATNTANAFMLFADAFPLFSFVFLCFSIKNARRRP